MNYLAGFRSGSVLAGGVCCSNNLLGSMLDLCGVRRGGVLGAGVCLNQLICDLQKKAPTALGLVTPR